jgi:hypothetical protein
MMPRILECAAILLMTALVGGCAAVPTDAPRIDAEAARAAVEEATGYELRAVPSPAGPPGLPQLEVSFTGGTPEESVDVLVFFSARAVRQAIGGATGGPGRATALHRENVIVIYRAARPDDDRRRAISAALLRLSSSP